MKWRSLRFKIAVAAGVVSVIAVVLFAALSISWFYSEEMEVVRLQSPPRPNQIKEALHSIPELIRAYLIVLPVVGGATALIAWWLAGSVARPLARLAGSVARPSPGSPMLRKNWTRKASTPVSPHPPVTRKSRDSQTF